MGLGNTDVGRLAALRPAPGVTREIPGYAIGGQPGVRLRIGLPPRSLIAITLGAALVLAFAFVSPMADRAPALRAAVETAITSLALTAAVVAQAQFVRTRRARDLVLFAAMLTLALIELSSYWVPAVFNVRLGGYFAAAERWGALFVAVAFVAASQAPADRLITRARRAVAITALVSVVAVGLAGLLGLVLRGQLLTASAYPLSGARHALRHPLGLLLTLETAGLSVLAAVAFARVTANEKRSGVLYLLACACVLLAAARLYSIPLDWLGPNWISPREGLRLLAITFVAAASVRQEFGIRAEIARAAAVAERHRVARDLHDGLAQDLALIAAHRQMMAVQLGGEHPVTVAAGRALALSRGTIKELSEPAGATIQDTLEAVGYELSARFEIDVAVHGDLDHQPALDTREHLARIAREAIANAARHGGATSVIVSLKETGNGVALRITDDGCGIGEANGTVIREGFGIHSMRERAADLGGRLTVRRSGKSGTQIEVVVP
jgi:signal transduction histidine kinase